MYFSEDIDAISVMPTLTPAQGTEKKYFTSGNPQMGQNATVWGHDIANIIVYELVNLVEKSGITLNKQSLTQVYEAVQRIAGSAGGILPWDATKLYDPLPHIVWGSDNMLYVAVKPSGPGIPAGPQDPTTTTGYWLSLPKYLAGGDDGEDGNNGKDGGWTKVKIIESGQSGLLDNEEGLVEVIVIGAGGGGGTSAAEIVDHTVNVPGGGGGGGGAVITYHVNIPANCYYAATIGAGGGISKGGGGSQIILDSSTTCTAGGGGGGGDATPPHGGGAGGGGGGLSGKGGDGNQVSNGKTINIGGDGGGAGGGRGGIYGNPINGGGGSTGGDGSFGGSGGKGGIQSGVGNGGGGHFGSGAGGNAGKPGSDGKIIIIYKERKNV